MWLHYYLEITAGIICLVSALVWRSRKFGDFPLVGKSNDIHEALKEGTKKYPTKAFAIRTSPPLVILPISMIDEVKSLPESKVSAARELFRRAAGHYSKMGTNSVAAIKALRNDLTRKTTTIPTLIEETDFAFSNTLEKYDEWTPVRVFPNINRVVSMVSGRMFLGKQLSRQEEWISISTQWSSDVFALLRRTQRYPSWLRPYITPYLSQTKKVLEQRRRAKKFLGPSFEEQLSAKREGLPSPGEESLATWMMKYLTPRHMQVESLVRHQLGISWASVHTSTLALTQIIYDLAARPEYLQPLRDELEGLMRGCDRELTHADLNKLMKMESFMKESLRINPSTVVSPLRLTVEPVTLSTGQTIPAGIPFGFYSYSINQSKALYHSPGPEVFDGFRFFNMRQKEGEEHKHQFGATGPSESFDFGHGIHACPGRFFACTEIKLLLAYILRNYDLKLRDGEARPPNTLDEIWFIADQTAEVLFRSRDSDMCFQA
ncbi:cytochrome P450 [Mollisia scopiformis]|uniref:Cytochrome P450 n=1 Tax=Mollisia scopiformis TaxID=149040 RepID=A0A194XN95_MOLSC|nr:cytochrome P450 [Mollisia scopiformis]KUJ21569.1 cytochrome P450 [Mollisia scopiformis]